MLLNPLMMQEHKTLRNVSSINEHNTMYPPACHNAGYRQPAQVNGWYCHLPFQRYFPSHILQSYKKKGGGFSLFPPFPSQQDKCTTWKRRY